MRRRPPSAERTLRLSASLLAVFQAFGVSSAAQNPPGPDKIGRWCQELKVDAFLSASYGYNLNDPPAGGNGYRVFDTKVQRLRLGLASLTLQKPAPDPGDLGFRIDVGAGESQPQVTAARGFFRSATTGGAGHFDVEQAYVTYVTDAGKGLRIDAGKFFAPIGYESAERYDAFNDNASHSFLFGYSAPFTTTGVEVRFPIWKTWSAMCWWYRAGTSSATTTRARALGARRPGPRIPMRRSPLRILEARSRRGTIPTGGTRAIAAEAGRPPRRSP